MNPVEGPPGLKGAIGAAAGLLKAAMRSLNELGFSDTGGGGPLAVEAGGAVGLAAATGGSDCGSDAFGAATGNDAGSSCSMGNSSSGSAVGGGFV